MAKLDGKDKPTYILSYPRPVRLARTAFMLLLVVAAVVNWILDWVHFLRPVILAAGGPVDPLDVLAIQPLRPLISAHLNLVLVALLLPFVYAFLPDLALVDEGLAVGGLFGWSVIPWTSIKVVRITSFTREERRAVLVQGNWTRLGLPYRLTSACMGAGFQPGVVFTSAIRDFGPLMLRLYQEVKAGSPDALFDDEFMSPSALMVMEPNTTLEILTEQARKEGWPLSLSAQAMAAVTGGLVLVQLFILLLEGGAWWKPIALVCLCTLEWAIGALYLYALMEIFPAHFEFRESALLYPLPQLPRALLALPMAMLVAAAIPFLAAMLGLAAVVWAVLLTVFMVQQMYRLKSILPAVGGGAFQAMFLFIELAIIFTG